MIHSRSTRAQLSDQSSGRRTTVTVFAAFPLIGETKSQETKFLAHRGKAAFTKMSSSQKIKRTARKREGVLMKDARLRGQEPTTTLDQQQFILQRQRQNKSINQRRHRHNHNSTPLVLRRTSNTDRNHRQQQPRQQQACS